MKLLDLFCGAGGAAMGYSRAGFDVVGVDHKSQPRYPFEFHCADAFAFLEKHGHEFDVIHASPPCQQYSPLRALHNWKQYPDLVAATRILLVAHAKQWVIENVMTAPMQSGVVLCGGMFGLRTYRHRIFETSCLLLAPFHPEHVAKTSMKKQRRCFDAGFHISVTGHMGAWIGPAVMGIDWMTGDELSQAVPPAYTEWIGRRLRELDEAGVTR